MLSGVRALGIIIAAAGWLATAVGGAWAAEDASAGRRDAWLVAGDSRSLWVVQWLEDSRYQLLHKTAAADPNVIHEGMASSGQPIAIASAGTLYVAYHNHAVQAIEHRTDPQTGLTQYGASQLPPLPAGATLVDFAADRYGPHALLYHAAAADPNDAAAGATDADAESPAARGFVLYALTRGRWTPVGMPPGVPTVRRDDRAIAMQLTVTDEPAHRVALLVKETAADGAEVFRVHHRNGESWRTAAYDIAPAEPWRATAVTGHDVVVERPRATGPLVARVWRAGRPLDAGAFAIPPEAGIDWAAVVYRGRLTIVGRNAAGELLYGQRDLTRAAGERIAMEPLVVRKPSMSALNRHFAMLGLALLAIVFLLAAWRRDPAAAMVQLPESLAVAEPTRRLGAAAIDLAAPLVVAVVATGANPGQILGALSSPFFEPNKLTAPVLIAAGLYVLHTLLSEMFTGTTLGKRLLGLRVVTNDGEPINLWQALLRNLVKPVELMAWPLLLFILLNPGRQRMGDLAARTTVARKAASGNGPSQQGPSDQATDEGE